MLCPTRFLCPLSARNSRYDFATEFRFPVPPHRSRILCSSTGPSTSLSPRRRGLSGTRCHHWWVLADAGFACLRSISVARCFIYSVSNRAFLSQRNVVDIGYIGLRVGENQLDCLDCPDARCRRNLLEKKTCRIFTGFSVLSMPLNATVP